MKNVKIFWVISEIFGNHKFRFKISNILQGENLQKNNKKILKSIQFPSMNDAKKTKNKTISDFIRYSIISQYFDRIDEFQNNKNSKIFLPIMFRFISNLQSGKSKIVGEMNHMNKKFKSKFPIRRSEYVFLFVSLFSGESMITGIDSDILKRITIFNEMIISVEYINEK